MIQEGLSNDPVSTASPAFLDALREALAVGSRLILLKRLVNCGGVKETHHLPSLPQADRILNHSKPADSISVFFPSTVPLRGKAGQPLAILARVHFELLGNMKDWGAIVKLGGGTAPAVVEYVETKIKIVAWLEDHPGIDEAIRTMNFCTANREEVLTAYIPVPDGGVRPGAS
jgi:hypothetical protein